MSTLSPLLNHRVGHIYSHLPHCGSLQEQQLCTELLYRHSRDVADLALHIASKHPELSLDLAFLEEAALLHDVGIVLTDAPGIHCHGTQPYICHGLLGQQLLLQHGLPAHAAVAARHTGAGITRQEIIDQQLPIPHTDLLPLTPEERLICYADKFFSKSHPHRRKTMAQARHSLQKFGGATIQRFEELVALFGEV